MKNYNEKREKLIGLVGILTGVGMATEDLNVRRALHTVSQELAEILDEIIIVDRPKEEPEHE